ncbi:hypothetical protein ELQ35_12535 [Peribacillus cavernae]|uniref:Uncharacterized protein n=1 Tax=Peribacillus cavernae TaxID=1674310 RepID=A0A3S0TUS9_9BACI|nr:hypothetical protein [Peribacillus cavernae]MDQ0218312.1 hypothetical protein [Peribacillus cavernae]RUQ28406.1 hypothetical protein ELQ35_12535 [Peribacillus cavernae]
MLRLLLRFTMLGGAVYFGFRYRYLLLNTVLSTGFLRKFLVTSTLNMPGVRNKMIQGVFKSE